MSATARAITVTLDLEDHRLGRDPARRYLDNATRVLDFLAARAITATVFVVGDRIDECAALLRRAVADGHEMALHSATHTPLTQTSAATLGRTLAAARARLEDVTSSAVRGFRAPVFSLTAATPWAPALLGELGFRYSSSVLPAAHPLYGYPGAPRSTFRWPCGLVEFPVPLARWGPAQVPFLGGIYLRYLPLALIARAATRLAAEVEPWTYLHPYDIDAAEGYYRFPGTSAAMSVLLWRRRRGTLARLAQLLARSGGAGPTFAARLARGWPAPLPVFPHAGA